MSDVCYDWTPVGYSSHPIPGDPHEVSQAGKAFGSTREHLSAAARALRKLDSSGTVSKAVDELRTNAREIARLLEAAVGRYDTASRALLTYAPELLKAKNQAEQAIQAATTAKREQDQAQSNSTSLWWGAKTNLDPAQRQEFLTAYYRSEAQKEEAEANLASARAQIESAISHRDGAARAAQSAIDPAINNQDLNDDLFDHLKQIWDAVAEFGHFLYENYPGLKALVDVIAAVGKWVWDHIDEIALVLTVVAFAIGWIPGLGQIAMALALAARIASAAAKVVGVVKFGMAIAKGVQTKNWSEVASTGAGMALSFGAGKLIGWGAGKLAKAGLSRVSKAGFDGIVRESTKQTGSYRTATNALLSGAKTPAYHPGHNPAAALTDMSKRTDSLISTFKGSDYTQRVANLNHMVQFAESSEAHELAERAIKQSLAPVKHGAVELGKELVGNQFDHRQATQACPVPVGAIR